MSIKHTPETVLKFKDIITQTLSTLKEYNGHLDIVIEEISEKREEEWAIVGEGTLVFYKFGIFLAATTEPKLTKNNKYKMCEVCTKRAFTEGGLSLGYILKQPLFQNEEVSRFVNYARVDREGFKEVLKRCLKTKLKMR